MGPTLAAAADTCVAQAANRRRAPNTRSSMSWPVEVLLARYEGSGSVGVAGRGGGLHLYEALQDAVDTIIGIEADLEVLLGRDGLVQFRRVLSQVAVLPTG
jgi:hypothetical protein